MPVTPLKFLEFSEGLLESKEEINIRNAMSRSYYASYHAGQPIGKKFALYADVEGGSHAQFISRFTEHSDVSVRKVGFVLRSCLSDRRIADYELDMDLSIDDALLAISQNKRVIGLLSELDEKYP